jgi:hypothetical protein
VSTSVRAEFPAALKNRLKFSGTHGAIGPHLVGGVAAIQAHTPSDFFTLPFSQVTFDIGGSD